MEWYYMYVWWPWLTSKMRRAGLSASAEPLVYCATLCVSAVLAVHRCLSVRLSRWFIESKRLKVSSHFFLRPVALPFQFFTPPSAGTQFRKEPLQQGHKIKGGGWEIFAIFDWNGRLSRIRYAISPWLLWNVNRKSYVLYRMVTFSMTLTDPNPVFKVTEFFEV